jgi:hypothetical protein
VKKPEIQVESDELARLSAIIVEARTNKTQWEKVERATRAELDEALARSAGYSVDSDRLDAIPLRITAPGRGGYVVSPVVSSRLDTKLLSAERPDIAAMYERRSVSYQLKKVKPEPGE